MRSKLKLGIHCFAPDDTFLIDGIRMDKIDGDRRYYYYKI